MTLFCSEIVSCVANSHLLTPQLSAATGRVRCGRIFSVRPVDASQAIPAAADATPMTAQAVAAVSRPAHASVPIPTSCDTETTVSRARARPICRCANSKRRPNSRSSVLVATNASTPTAATSPSGAPAIDRPAAATMKVSRAATDSSPLKIREHPACSSGETIELCRKMVNGSVINESWMATDIRSIDVAIA